MRHSKAVAAFAIGVGLFGAGPVNADPVTWGSNATANTALGILNATSIPTNGTVTFTNVSGDGYDIVITTSSLNQSNLGNMGADNTPSWFFEGGAASSVGGSIPYSTVTVRFYATGTTDPFYLTGLDFKLVDAEEGERFKNFAYYSAHGDLVPFATTADPIGSANPALTFSTGAPHNHFSDSSVDNNAPNDGGTQTDKWIRFSLSGQAVSGFQFQAGRVSSSNGSIEVTGLGDLVHQLQQIGAGAPVSAGDSYDGLAATSPLDGAGTQVQLLGGKASVNRNVTVGFSLVSTSGFQAGAGSLSDVVNLQGTFGDKVVLQLSYDPAALAPGQLESDVFVGWFNGGALVNAVDGNTDLPGEVNDPLFHLGAYDPATDFHLGYYGVDPVNNVAWAVIDHNSEFTAVPEPAAAGFFLLGGCALAGRRRRRSA